MTIEFYSIDSQPQLPRQSHQSHQSIHSNKSHQPEPLDQSYAPLYEQITRHLRSGSTSFHIPGHKAGGGLPADGALMLLQTMRLDYTEIPGLDDLHQPEGVILEAQQLAAECFGAEQTYFLVGGSTAGNLAAILSLCGHDDIVLVQRNAHKSVIHGLMLAGARAVFLSPRWDQEIEVATGLDPSTVSQALQMYPQAKALILTNPNYYGMGVDLAPIVNHAHRYNVPVIVDEAHGAHFGFHPEIPQSALRSGADIVIQSTHKMLTSLTMSSMLHVQGKLVNRERLAHRLAMLQSTSPSYPLMASLDLARRFVAQYGRQSLEEGLEAVRYFVEKMKTLPSFKVYSARLVSDAYETKDPLKVVVRDETGTWNGFELLRQLQLRHCHAELADPAQVLLIFSLASNIEDAERLFMAFQTIFSKINLKKQEKERTFSKSNSILNSTLISSPVTFSLETGYGNDAHAQAGNVADNNQEASRSAAVRHVPILESVGYRSADLVIPYPPGIPVLYPGEQIEAETARYLMKLSKAGSKFHGTQIGNLLQISVLDG